MHNVKKHKSINKFEFFKACIDSRVSSDFPMENFFLWEQTKKVSTSSTWGMLVTRDEIYSTIYFHFIEFLVQLLYLCMATYIHE